MISSFKQLECFFSLAKTLSFSKTGEQLKIAQPAVSKHIKQLEQEMGAQLFIRSKKSVILSPKGKELLQQLSPYWDGLHAEIDNFISEGPAIKGEIKIGCLQEVGQRVFLPVLSDLKKQHPELNIDIRYLKSKEIVDGLKTGKLHLGIISEKLLDESIRIYKAFEEEILLVKGAKTPKPKCKISALPFVSYREADPLLEFYLKKVSPGFKLNKVSLPFKVNSHKSMIDLLIEHPYYAVLPRHSVADELKSKKLNLATAKSFTASLYLAHLELDIKNPKIEVVREHILNKVVRGKR